MDWQALEAFLTLADELHFGRTADRLHLSRARVSQLIKMFERQIGAPLFERTSRRVALTSIGRHLHADLAPHHDGIRRALATAADLARGVSGVVRVGFSSPRASEVITTIADDFRTRHPECEVWIREVHLSDRYSALRSGEIDLQLIEFPVIEPDVVTGPVLFRDNRVLAVSGRHRFAQRETVHLDDLAEESVLTIAGMPDYFLDEVAPAFTPSGKPVRRSSTTTYWQELLALVAADEGVTVCAAQGAHYYPRPNLVYLPLLDAAPFDYGLVWTTTGSTARSRSFTQLAIETAARTQYFGSG